MLQEQLISKLIDLEEQAKADSSEYLRLLKEPPNAGASFADSNLLRLRSRIQNIRRQIVLLRRHLQAESLAKTRPPALGQIW